MLFRSANRVAEGKSNGLIIDYIGIVKALRKALADYTANVNGNSGTDPTVDKEKLIARILETIGAAEQFLNGHGFDLGQLISAAGFEKLALLQTAANAVSDTIEEKKTFQTYASELLRLMKYADREDIAPDVRKRYEAIAAIYGELKKKRRSASNVELINKRPSQLKKASGEKFELLKAIEHAKSSVRSKVEHVFCVIKRIFHFCKTRYRGREKLHQHCCTLFALANLYLARNRMKVA